MARWTGAAWTPVQDATSDDFDRIIGVNLKGVWLGLKYEIPHMLAHGGGAIVNTASAAAFYGFALPAYNASKWALRGLTKTAALEYGRHNIRVNILCPGSMNTPMNIDTAAGFNPQDPESGLKALAASMVTGRVSEPEEVAAVGVFLLLDAPIQMTGTLVPVDGGYSAR